MTMWRRVTNWPRSACCSNVPRKRWNKPRPSWLFTPRDRRARLLYARSLLASGDVTRSRAKRPSCSRIRPRTWNPKDALGWYYLGRTKYNENRFEEAVSAFEQCLTLDPKDVKAEDNLGLSYEGLNQADKAIAAYRNAIAWQADAAVKNPGPLLDLGSLLVDSNRSEEALPYLLEAARMTPQDYRVHRQLGKAYVHLNRLENAQAELEEAAKLAPENAPVHFMLAQVYRKQGLPDKAKLESDRYTALAGSNPPPEN